MNPNTKVTVRLATESLLNGDKVFGESDTYYQTNLDRIYVSHNIGKYVTTNIGRQDLRVGNGYFYDEVFDGAVVKVRKERLNASFSRGHLLGGFRTTFDSEFKIPVSVYQLNYKPSQHVAATGFYVTVYNNQYDNVFGGSLDFALGRHNKVWLGGEYVREEHNTAYGESWTAGVGYGEAQILKPHTWGAKVQYFKVGADGPIVANRWKLRHIQNIDHRGYLATLDYTLAKNVGLSVYGIFRSQRGLVYLNDTHEYLGADMTYTF